MRRPRSRVRQIVHGADSAPFQALRLVQRLSKIPSNFLILASNPKDKIHKRIVDGSAYGSLSHAVANCLSGVVSRSETAQKAMPLWARTTRMALARGGRR